MSEETEVAVEETEVNVEVPEDATININDLANCVNIIDMCAKRGAFEGPELEQVGTLRSRLVKFVNSSVPPEVQQDEEMPQEGDD